LKRERPPKIPRGVILSRKDGEGSPPRSEVQEFVCPLSDERSLGRKRPRDDAASGNPTRLRSPPAFSVV